MVKGLPRAGRFQPVVGGAGLGGLVNRPHAFPMPLLKLGRAQPVQDGRRLGDKQVDGGRRRGERLLGQLQQSLPEFRRDVVDGVAGAGEELTDIHLFRGDQPTRDREHPAAMHRLERGQ